MGVSNPEESVLGPVFLGMAEASERISFQYWCNF